MIKLNSFLGGFFAVLLLAVVLQLSVVLAFIIRPSMFYFRPWEYIKEFAEKTAQEDSTWRGSSPGDLSRQNYFLYQDKVDLLATTDKDGFRSVPRKSGKFRIAVAGDSNIFGSRLSDDETFPWLLANKADIAVFNAGRVPILSALSRPNLSGVRLVIDGMAGRSVPHYYQMKDKTLLPYRPLAHEKRDVLDVLSSVNNSRYLIPHMVSRNIKRLLQDVVDMLNGDEKSYLFLPHKQKLRNIPLAIDVINQRRQIFNALGYQYMVMIVPAKQTIYDENVDRESRQFGGKLVKALNANGIVALDLYTEFENRKSEGLYHRYDTHWNGKGTSIAADQALRRIMETYPDLLKK